MAREKETIVFPNKLPSRYISLNLKLTTENVSKRDRYKLPENMVYSRHP